MSTRAACFWASAAGAAWVLVGYPASLLLRRERPWSRGDDLPSVTILIPAYTERETLPRKLTELRNLDYPSDRLEVVVVVDEDAELAAIARAAHPEASVIFSPDRGGKSAALSRGLATAQGDIVVMTDANNVLERESVRAAARHFADAEVWAVAGRRGEAGSAYDRYESLIRSLESRSGSVAAMSGEFMAVRRDRIPRSPSTSSTTISGCSVTSSGREAELSTSPRPHRPRRRSRPKPRSPVAPGWAPGASWRSPS